MTNKKVTFLFPRYGVTIFEFLVKANIGYVLGFKFQIDFTYFFTNVGFKLTVLY